MENDAESDADQMLAGLSRLALFWREAGWRSARAEGLTPTQAEALAHLARRGPSRNAALAAALSVTPATMSDAAGALTAKGLLRREPDPADARAVLLAPTAAGAETAARLPEAPSALATLVSALPADERATLLRVLSRLIRGLQEAGAIPVQRMCVGCRYFRPFVHPDAAQPHHCAFVDAAFGEAALRLDCGDHEAAAEEERARLWARFAAVP